MAASKRVMQVAIDDFNMKIAPGKRAEEEAMIRALPTFALAITFASQGKTARGTRHGHLRRRSQATLDECTRIHLAHEADLARSKDFEDVYHWVEKLLGGVHDVADLTRYDIATPIAVWMNLMPTRVYLHAGVRKGAAYFGIPKSAECIGPSERHNATMSHYRCVILQLHWQRC
jgi:hypothetical protein